MLAGCYHLMGRHEDAKQAGRMLLRYHPQVTVRYLKEALPHTVVAAQQGYFSLMAEAGIPEE